MTIEELRELIIKRIESTTERDDVLAWATRSQGKPIRSNTVPDGWTIRREYGWTRLQAPRYWERQREADRAYKAGEAYYGYAPEMLLARTETGAMVPTPEWLANENPAYFDGLDKRNAQRRALLNNPAALAAIVAAVNARLEAEAAKIAAEKAYNAAVESFPDSFALEAAAGLRQR